MKGMNQMQDVFRFAVPLLLIAFLSGCGRPVDAPTDVQAKERIASDSLVAKMGTVEDVKYLGVEKKDGRDDMYMYSTMLRSKKTPGKVIKLKVWFWWNPANKEWELSYDFIK